jgi:carbon-monoxide dehydrogenase medium subunit
MKLPKFDYACPGTIEEAVALLARADGTARPISGGQSLMPMLAFRLVQPSLLVDLRHVPGLAAITIDNDGVHLGAKVRWCDIETSAALQAAYPILTAAVRHIAHHQIRTRGTIGGSIAHADPAAEMPCVAVLCDAEIEIVGSAGKRKIPATSFFKGPLMTALQPDELITGIRFPAWPAQRRWAFEEFARRRGDFALAGIAMFFDMRDDKAGNVHIAAFGIGDTPLRLANAEAALNNRPLTEAVIKACCQAGQQEVDPPDDIHGSSAYRRGLVDYLLGQSLRRLTGHSAKAAANAH